jgi:putative endonuclease
LCVCAAPQKGYGIIARDLRTPIGEVDIVARRGRMVAFVEVKARTTLESAATALGGEQRQRIARAAEYVMASRSELRDTDVRFDVMLVVPWRLPTHIMNAWEQ